MNCRNFKSLLFFVFLIVFLAGCEKEEIPNNNEDEMPTDESVFQIDGSTIKHLGEGVSFKGVNTLQTFGLGDQALMDEWNVKIIREFIGNLREQPITNGAIQGTDGVWYHPLQTIVDANREHGRITILCPFGWVDEQGERQLLTGLNPSEQTFYMDYLNKMQAIADHFKEQPDVWIEVWNEPFSWNNSNGYSHEKWLEDMEEMVDNLRGVNGFENIIVVPGNEQGQSENAILEKGNDLLEDRKNLLFDLHAYEKWLNGTDKEDIKERIESMLASDFAFIFGEVGVENVGGVMPVQHFLDAADESSVSVMAWLWNKNSSDKNALLNDEGLPNATEENNLWGMKYRDFILD